MGHARIERLDTYSRTEGGLSPISPFKMTSTHGLIDVSELPGLTSLLIGKPDGSHVVAILLYQPGLDPNEVGVGHIAQLKPEVARRLSKSLAHLADLAEQNGRG